MDHREPGWAGCEDKSLLCRNFGSIFSNPADSGLSVGCWLHFHKRNISYFLLRESWGHWTPRRMCLPNPTFLIDWIVFPLGHRTWTGSQTLGSFEPLLSPVLGKSLGMGIKKVHLHLYRQRTQLQRYLRRRQHTPEPRINKNVIL